MFKQYASILGHDGTLWANTKGFTVSIRRVESKPVIMKIVLTFFLFDVIIGSWRRGKKNGQSIDCRGSVRFSCRRWFLRGRPKVSDSKQNQITPDLNDVHSNLSIV